MDQSAARRTYRLLLSVSLCVMVLYTTAIAPLCLCILRALHAGRSITLYEELLYDAYGVVLSRAAAAAVVVANTVVALSYLYLQWRFLLKPYIVLEEEALEAERAPGRWARPRQKPRPRDGLCRKDARACARARAVGGMKHVALKPECGRPRV